MARPRTCEKCSRLHKYTAYSDSEMVNSKPIRRSQLISPFGVGALVDFRGDESLMTAGLEAWPLALEECPLDWLVVEERLQTRLGVTHFRLPRNIAYPAKA